MDIATATIKIRAPLVHPDPRDHLVPMATPVPMEARDHLDHPVSSLIGSILSPLANASNAHQEEKAPPERKVPPDPLARREDPVERDPTERTVDLARPARPEMLRPPDRKAPLDRLATKAAMPPLEPRASPDPLDQPETTAPLDPRATMEPQEKLAPLVAPDQPEAPARTERTVAKDPPDPPDRKDRPAPMPSIARAHDEPRRPSPKPEPDNPIGSTLFVLYLFQVLCKRSSPVVLDSSSR